MVREDPNRLIPNNPQLPYNNPNNPNNPPNNNNNNSLNNYPNFPSFYGVNPIPQNVNQLGGIGEFPIPTSDNNSNFYLNSSSSSRHLQTLSDFTQNNNHHLHSSPSGNQSDSTNPRNNNNKNGNGNGGKDKYNNNKKLLPSGSILTQWGFRFNLGYQGISQYNHRFSDPTTLCVLTKNLEVLDELVLNSGGKTSGGKMKMKNNNLDLTEADRKNTKKRSGKHEKHNLKNHKNEYKYNLSLISLLPVLSALKNPNNPNNPNNPPIHPSHPSYHGQTHTHHPYNLVVDISNNNYYNTPQASSNHPEHPNFNTHGDPQLQPRRLIHTNTGHLEGHRHHHSNEHVLTIAAASGATGAHSGSGEMAGKYDEAYGGQQASSQTQAGARPGRMLMTIQDKTRASRDDAQGDKRYWRWSLEGLDEGTWIHISI